jgi:hypothetical protein
VAESGYVEHGALDLRRFFQWQTTRVHAWQQPLKGDGSLIGVSVVWLNATMIVAFSHGRSITSESRGMTAPVETFPTPSLAALALTRRNLVGCFICGAGARPDHKLPYR